MVKLVRSDEVCKQLGIDDVEFWNMAERGIVTHEGEDKEHFLLYDLDKVQDQLAAASKGAENSGFDASNEGT